MTTILTQAFLLSREEEEEEEEEKDHTLLRVFTSRPLVQNLAPLFIKQLSQEQHLLQTRENKKGGGGGEKEQQQLQNQNQNKQNNKKKKQKRTKSESELKIKQKQIVVDFLRQHAPPCFTYVELFAGLGGFSVPLEQLGGKCLFASDLDSNAKSAWLANHHHFHPQTQHDNNINQNHNKSVFRFGDITQVQDSELPSPGTVDLLCGGFPCQPFSNARANAPGLESSVGQLFRAVVRVLKFCKPKCFLLENVPGLLTANEGAAIKEIRSALSEEAGYSVKTAVIDSSFLVPQVRRRLYFVGIRQSENTTASSSVSSSPSSATSCSGSSGSTSSSSTPSSFRFPRFPDLSIRAFSEIKEVDETICRKFQLSSARWNELRKVSSEKNRVWCLDESKPGLTLTRKYRSGPGTVSAKLAIEQKGATFKKFVDMDCFNNKNNKQNENRKSGEGRKMRRVREDQEEEEDNSDKEKDQEEEEQEVVIQQENFDDEREDGGDQKQENEQQKEEREQEGKEEEEAPRYLTAREAARMQGLPEYFILPRENEPDGASIALCGNAVTVPVVGALFHRILSTARIPKVKIGFKSFVDEMVLACVPVHNNSDHHHHHHYHHLRKKLREATFKDVAVVHE